MLFNVYGRYDLEVTRTDGSWAVYRVEGGKRRRAELAVPPDLPEEEVGTYLDDLLHELARPGDEVRRVR